MLALKSRSEICRIIQGRLCEKCCDKIKWKSEFINEVYPIYFSVHLFVKFISTRTLWCWCIMWNVLNRGAMSFNAARCRLAWQTFPLDWRNTDMSITSLHTRSACIDVSREKCNLDINIKKYCVLTKAILWYVIYGNILH